MKKVLNAGIKWLAVFGVEPLKVFSAMKNLPTTIKEYSLIKTQNSALNKKWEIKFSAPSLHERNSESGVASGHYFHQDLLVARSIYEQKPKKHVDIGSRVDGFVAHVAVFREIEVFDIRPLPNNIPNIKFIKEDLMNPKIELSDYCDSLSCLHALEHFGLGRYGDSIEIEGYLYGFNILTKMLKSQGILYLSVPIGRERIEFNGHRIFSLQRIFNLFKDKFELLKFSYVDDKGNLLENVTINKESFDNDFNLNYGCGIFELMKY